MQAKMLFKLTTNYRVEMITIDQQTAALSKPINSNNQGRPNKSAVINTARIFWYRHKVFSLNFLFVTWLASTAGALGWAMLNAPDGQQCTHHMDLN
jgi:hypothetical protein